MARIKSWVLQAQENNVICAIVAKRLVWWRELPLSCLNYLTKGKVKTNMNIVIKMMRILGRLPGTFFQQYEVLS